jgi:hypothetical protein
MNFINSGCIPSVPAALLFFKFLIAFFTSSTATSSTSTSSSPISLFPFLIHSFGSFVFSNLSKHSFHISSPTYQLGGWTYIIETPNPFPTRKKGCR